MQVFVGYFNTKKAGLTSSWERLGKPGQWGGERWFLASVVGVGAGLDRVLVLGCTIEREDMGADVFHEVL